MLGAQQLTVTHYSCTFSCIAQPFHNDKKKFKQEQTFCRAAVHACLGPVQTVLC